VNSNPNNMAENQGILGEQNPAQNGPVERNETWPSENPNQNRDPQRDIEDDEENMDLEEDDDDPSVQPSNY
jgi:hypothetical protein